MENKTFDKIVALAGAPGLYFVVGQRPNGLILEEIGNPTRKFATSARQKVSVLADIAMFTEDEDVKLGEILLSAKKLEDNGTSIPNKKDAEENIIEVFGKVLTNYDKERVRVSDMKKLFSWYHILKGNFDFNLINKVDEENKEEIASSLGIPRPSLSRELMNLRDLNYIEFDRNIIKILNIEELEAELFD